MKTFMEATEYIDWQHPAVMAKAVDCVFTQFSNSDLAPPLFDNILP